MKRNLIYTLCAAALLGLGGCEKDLSPNDPTGNPTPDANGMVTFDLAVTTGGYEDGVPETRAGQAPYTFVHDLGDGYVMTSTLTPQPKTRAGESQQVLADGTTVLMVAFASTDTQGATPLGYELLSVLYGKIAISLPAGQTFNLAFISYNDQTVFKPEDFIAWTGEATTTNRHYYALPPGATLRNWTDGDETHHVPMVMKTDTDSIPADYVVSRLTNYPPTGMVTAMPIHFKRAFAQLKWMLNVNPNVYHEYVGDLDAGFYKKHQKAWPRLANVASGANFTGSTDKSTYPWAGYAEPNLPAGNFFQYTYNSEHETTSFEDSTAFIPIPNHSSTEGANQSAQIYINSMTIKNPSGDKVVTDVALPILYGGRQNMIFKPGCSYTVTSNVTKKITWATSNIYWDGTQLTFDADAADGGVAGEIPNVTNGGSSNYQGLVFKWGSLVGLQAQTQSVLISPSFPIRIYVPANRDGELNTGYTVWDGLTYNHSQYIKRDSISSASSVDITVLQNDGTSIYVPGETEHSDNWYGDICAYITQGRWHMPTLAELNPAGQTIPIPGGLSDEAPALGWWRAGVSWANSSTLPMAGSSEDLASGRGIVAGGDVDATTAYGITLRTSTGKDVKFPATGGYIGWTQPNTVTASDSYNSVYRSAAPNVGLWFVSNAVMYMENDFIFGSGNGRTFAGAVRCVKNYE